MRPGFRLSLGRGARGPAPSQAIGVGVGGVQSQGSLSPAVTTAGPCTGSSPAPKHIPSSPPAEAGAKGKRLRPVGEDTPALSSSRHVQVHKHLAVILGKALDAGCPVHRSQARPADGQGSQIFLSKTIYVTRTIQQETAHIQTLPRNSVQIAARM